MDGQLTLVHFLEDIIETKYPEISGFENELTHVEQAARGKEKCTPLSRNLLSSVTLVEAMWVTHSTHTVPLSTQL